MTVEIQLSRGLVAVVDQCDAARVVAAGPWYALLRGQRGPYARTDMTRPDGSRSRPYLHTFITGLPFVDHVNGDGLDNRRCNLRLATRSQNGANRGPQANNQSGFKGVSRLPYSRWKAQIRFQGRDIYLGSFVDPEDAARAYDARCLDLFGEFARLNFPLEQA